MHLDGWDDSVHTEEKQLSKIDKARSFRCTPRVLDRANRSAVFLDSKKPGKTYKTTLSNCTCLSFTAFDRGLPCKHMYRLYYELNEPDAIQSGLYQADVIYSMFSFAPRTQEVFYNICSANFNKHKGLLVKAGAAIDELISCSFLIETLDVFTPFAENMELSELKKLFPKEYFPDVTYRSKPTFMQWLAKEQHDAPNEILKYVEAVELAECVESPRQIVNLYAAKFTTERVFTQVIEEIKP